MAEYENREKVEAKSRVVKHQAPLLSRAVYKWAWKGWDKVCEFAFYFQILQKGNLSDKGEMTVF